MFAALFVPMITLIVAVAIAGYTFLSSGIRAFGHAHRRLKGASFIVLGALLFVPSAIWIFFFVVAGFLYLGRSLSVM